jgi:hypothetical protein
MMTRVSDPIAPNTFRQRRPRPTARRAAGNAVQIPGVVNGAVMAGMEVTGELVHVGLADNHGSGDLESAHDFRARRLRWRRRRSRRWFDAGGVVRSLSAMESMQGAARFSRAQFRSRSRAWDRIAGHHRDVGVDLRVQLSMRERHAGQFHGRLSALQLLGSLRERPIGRRRGHRFERADAASSIASVSSRRFGDITSSLFRRQSRACWCGGVPYDIKGVPLSVNT